MSDSRFLAAVPMKAFGPLVLAAALAIASCSPAVDESGTPQRIVRSIDALLLSVAQSELSADPELATRLGLDEEIVGYGYNQYLTDRSQAAYERMRVKRLEIMEALDRAPAPAPASRQARHLAAVTAAYDTAESLFVFGHGETGLGVSYPYVTDHMRGAYLEIPELLTRAHPIRTEAEAEAYVARLLQVSDALGDERRRLIADARAGIIPPHHILQRMQALAMQMGTGPADQHVLYTTFQNLSIGANDLSSENRESLSGRALTALETEILPAYASFSAEISDLIEEAPEAPGIWQLPRGDAYYDTALAAYTHDGIDADALFETGQAEVSRLLGELDAALLALGFDEGTVAERLQALSVQEGQLYDDTPEGQANLITRLNAHYDSARAHLSDILADPPESPVVIRAVPEFLQAASPSAYYSAAPANGTAPATFEINLANMNDWPDYSLATLVFHETVPGHHLESAYVVQEADLPLIRQMTWNTAYGEGWGVYAETLADDLGLYADDPLSRIGYLQSMLFRAARLVTDTGIHRKRWSRQTAIDYLVTTTGHTETAMAEEVDRYTVWPGQAAAYWVGARRILDLRERSELVLGPDFDLAAFHDVVLRGGPRPLDIMEADVERWYSAQIRESD